MSALLGVVAGGRYSRQISTVSSQSVSGTAGATSILVPWPTAGSITGNVLNLLAVALKPGTANTGSVTTPAGWSLVDNFIGGGYGGTLGAGTGNTHIYVFSKAADNTATGSLSVTLVPNGASGVACATMSRFEKTSAVDWQTIVAAHAESTTPGISTPTFSPSLTMGVGDVIFYAFGLATSLGGTTTLTAGTGLAGLSPAIAVGPFTLNGFQVSCVSSARRAQLGGALPSYILTCPVNERGASIVARLRVR